MKAITVRQPWAWAIVHGGKTIENRALAWSYRGPLAIHAGLRWSERGGADTRVIQAFVADWRRRNLPPGFAELAAQGLAKGDLANKYGVILGVAELVDAHPDAGCCRPWGESTYTEHPKGTRRVVAHLVLDNVRALAEPIPCKGALGLWTPAPHVLDQLAAEVTR